MSKFGRQPINDAGRPRPKLAYTFEGEQRIDIRPTGHVERFVDPGGNVVSLQLASDGTPNREEAVAKARVRFHRDGFVEHAKCPIKHGIRYTHASIEASFVDLPENLQRPCEADIKTLVRQGSRLEALRSCPHIEWLITDRRKKVAEENAARNASRAADEQRLDDQRELQRVQLEIAREELEAKRAARAAKQPKGKQTEAT